MGKIRYGADRKGGGPRVAIDELAETVRECVEKRQSTRGYKRVTDGCWSSARPPGGEAGHPLPLRAAPAPPGDRPPGATGEPTAEVPPGGVGEGVGAVGWRVAVHNRAARVRVRACAVDGTWFPFYSFCTTGANYNWHV